MTRSALDRLRAGAVDSEGGVMGRAIAVDGVDPAEPERRETMAASADVEFAGLGKFGEGDSDTNQPSVHLGSPWRVQQKPRRPGGGPLRRRPVDGLSRHLSRHGPALPADTGRIQRAGFGSRHLGGGIVPVDRLRPVHLTMCHRVAEARELLAYSRGRDISVDDANLIITLPTDLAERINAQINRYAFAW